MGRKLTRQDFPMFLAGALVGAIAICCLLIKFDVHPKSADMSYADLSALLLTAVGILVTVLGVFVAILALWGYAQLNNAAEVAAIEHVEESLNSGRLREELSKQVKALTEAHFRTSEFKKLVHEAVAITLQSDAEYRDRQSKTKFSDSDES